MDMTKEKVCRASLVAIFIMTCGINAMGAEYGVGSANDDWWTAYPDQSSGSGDAVNHPSWVLDALEAKPLLIYVHKQCDYCVPQTEAAKKIADDFQGKITFYEIDADSGDVRAEEGLQAYDPNGGTMYVPLTVVLTLALDSEGNVVPVWHSTDEITGEGWIKNYVEDAIKQYDENSANWNS
ncbi:MAG: thioredoxin family protein [Methanothrix sp.]|nr:thioredoxin family protein [Methanothrix sp.]